MTPDFVARFRAAMPVSQRWAYFDHAAVAPLPLPTQQAISGWLTQATESGDVSWPDWARRLEELRSSAAGLIHAETDEIALIPNTTTGIGLVAEGLAWKPGDNVVVPANEFPSNLYPWLNLADRGVEVRRVAVPDGRLTTEQLSRAIDKNTRLLAISWVGFASGWRIDVGATAELCKSRGCLFFLDAIQGLGVFPLDAAAAGVDFLAADGHKWLLGPEGAGILYVRREHLAALRPLMVGWNSVQQHGSFDDTAFTLRPTAARYEGGTLNMPGMLGLAASVALLRELGAGPNISGIGDRVIALTDFAVEQLRRIGAEILSPREPGRESGIVVFRRGDEPCPLIRRRLLEAGCVVSCRGGGLRISPHAYNTEADIERLCDALHH